MVSNCIAANEYVTVAIEGFDENDRPTSVCCSKYVDIKQFLSMWLNNIKYQQSL